MPFLGNTPEFIVVDSEKQTITGNGAATYDLSNQVESATDLEVFVNNIRQEPDVAYTISGQQITFANTVANTDSIYVIFNGKPLATTEKFTPQVNSVSTAILQDDAVTGDKIASNTITLDNVTFEVGGSVAGKNLVINGDMKVAQRPQLAGFSNAVSNVSTSSFFHVDRFRVYNFATGDATVEYSSDAPDGFSNSLRLESEETTSISSIGLCGILYHIESVDITPLKKGTSQAANTTLSFYTKTNFPGTFQVNVYDPANLRQTSKRFTISTANTWEQHVLTFIGDTDANGTPNYDSNTGLILEWFIDAGSAYQSGVISEDEWASSGTANSFVNCTSGFSTTQGNEFYIAGVQYEVGDEATNFNYRSYAETLNQCERYFQVIKPFSTSSVGLFTSHFGGSSAYFPLSFRTPMRASPSANVLNSSIEYYSFAGAWTSTSLLVTITSSTHGTFVATSDGDGRGKLMRPGSSGTADSPIGLFSAELT